MTYYIVGSGNMAWFLVKRLTEAGHTCKGIYGRNKDAVNALASACQLPICKEVVDIKDDADICVLAVADKAIKEIADSLSFKKTVLIHNAGGADMDLLAGAALHYGVLWCIYSIVKHDLPNHRNIPFVYEASSTEAKDILQQITTGITDVAYKADSANRKSLHLAAVFSNNFTNHMMTIAEQLCKEHNMPFSLLQPIMQQTMDRLAHTSPYELQTGPARRNDENTIQHHLALLEIHPGWQNVYNAINQSIKAMYNNTEAKKL